MLNDYIKTLSQYLLPKTNLTALAGRFANIKYPPIKNFFIQRFIKQYQVNMDEALIEDPKQYATFNDFFIRKLKPECRPISDADIISPVDGSISEIGDIENNRLFQAKDRYYTVDELLGFHSELSEPFYQGRFATLYLSPKDYHRVHTPISCTLKEMVYIPGRLFSVQPATTKIMPKLFARNERLAIFLDTPAGLMAMVMVGATIVGSISTQWHGDIKRSRRTVHFDYKTMAKPNSQFQKADEIGYFKLGSTVILMFADHGRMSWESSLQAGKSIRLGEALGNLIR